MAILKPFALLADPVLRRDAHVLQRDPPGRAGPHAQLAVQIAGADPRAVQLHQERATAHRADRRPPGRCAPPTGSGGPWSPARSTSSRRSAHIRRPPGAPCCGSPPHPSPPPVRSAQNRRSSRPAPAATRKRCFCSSRAPLQQPQAVQPHVHRHHHPQGRVDRFQLFAGQPQGDVIHPLPAVAHRQADPQDAQLCPCAAGRTAPSPACGLLP